MFANMLANMFANLLKSMFMDMFTHMRAAARVPHSPRFGSMPIKISVNMFVNMFVNVFVIQIFKLFMLLLGLFSQLRACSVSVAASGKFVGAGYLIC